MELVTIHSLETTKFIKYCRYDFIRFDNDCDYWVLNKEWQVKTFLCLMDGFGMQVMVCKNYHLGITKL